MKPISLGESRTCLRPFVFLFSAILVCFPAHLVAADREWANLTSGDWTDMGNWAGSAMPGGGDTARVQNSGTALINGVTATTINRLEVGGPTANRRGALEIINGGTLAVNTHIMSAAAANSYGEITVRGPGSTLASLNASSFMYLGRTGTGVLNILDGAKVISAGAFSMGYDPSGGTNIPVGVNPAAYTTISGAGSLLQVDGDGHIGFRGVGILTLANEAQARFKTNVFIGNGAGGKGELHVGKGTSVIITSADKVMYVGGNAAGMGGVNTRSALLAGAGVLDMGIRGIVKISHNGTLSAGDNPGEIGTLSILGSLNLSYNDGTPWGTSRAGAATIRVDHDSSSADLIYVSNTVLVGPNLNIDLSSLSSVTNRAIVATSSTGAINSSLASWNFTINGAEFSSLDRLAGNLPVASLSVSGSQILMTLNSTAPNKNIVWTGATDNIWNLTGTNWREAGGGSLAFLTGDSVTFASLGGVTSATISQDVGQTASQLLFIGDTSYTLQGNYTTDKSSAVSLTTGTSGKLLLGASGTAFNGMLTLTGNNHFASGVELHSGTLSMARVENLGRAGYVLNGVRFQGADSNIPTLLITDNVSFEAGNRFGHLSIAFGDTGRIQIASGKTMAILSGSSNGSAAAISNRGQFTIDGGQVTFANNHADLNGGAIANGNDGTLVVSDAQFTSNTSGSLGGAIYNAGNSNVTIGVAATSTVAYAGNRALNGGAAAAAAAGGFLYMSSGTANLDIAGHVTIGGNDALATGADSIASASAGAVINKTGTGTLVLNADNTHYTGVFNIDAGTVVVNNARSLSGGAINGAASLILNNVGDDLAFASGDFHGTLRLQGTTGYDLANVSVSPALAPTRAILASSHVQLASGASLAIGSGSYALRGLDFAGGKFRTAMSGLSFSGTLKVSGTLALNDPNNSKIIVTNLNPGDTLPVMGGGGAGNIFSMDEAGLNAILLISAGAIADGHVGRTVALYTSDGVTPINTVREIAWSDASGTYAIATFENMAVAISGSAGAGLYMDSLLTKVDIQNGRTFTLAADTTSDNTLNAIITGVGEFAINASAAAVTLGGNNTHTGITRIVSGTLRLAAANALGNTSNLILSQNTSAELAGDDVFGNSHIIGAYTGASGAKLGLGSGTLTVSNAKGTGLFVDNGATTDFDAASTLILNGGTISGVLTAASGNSSRLVVNSSTLTISSANPGIEISTTIAPGATLRLTDGGALGSGTIAFDGTLELAANGANTNFNNRFVGTGTESVGNGTIRKTGTGSITIVQSNPDLNVPVIVSEGRLIAAAFDSLGISVITTQAGGAIEFSGVEGTLANSIVGDGMLAFSNNANVTIAREYTIPQIEISTGARVIASHLGALGGTSGKIHVTSNGALVINTYDNATRTFALGEVTLTDHGRIRFTPAGTTFRRATIEKLSGSDGILEFNVDFKAVRDHSIAALSPVMPVGRAANHITIKIAGNGTHGVYVNDANPAYFAPVDGSYTPLIDTAAGDATRFQLVDVNGAPVPYYESGLIALKLVKGGEDESSYTDNPDRWYLADNGLSSLADAVIATTVLQGMDWHFSMDSLNQRMGDVRAQFDQFIERKARGDVWMRGRSYSLKANYKLVGRPFEQISDGLSAGADKAFVIGGGAVVLGGIFVDCNWVDRDLAEQGTSKTQGIGFGVYATMLHESGWYGDLVMKADRMTNEFEARTVDGRTSSGDFDNTLEGVSLEFGKRVELKNEWWFEPFLQASYAWLNSVEYDVKNAERSMPVKVDGAHSTQYRGGLRIGRELSRWYPYAKMAWAKTDNNGGTIHAHTKTISVQTNEWRFETGLGLNMRLSDRSNLYFDYEYATSTAYERPWSFNIGFRTGW